MPLAHREERWFARRFPVGDPRSSMGPVHWKGWTMFGIFIAMTILSAAAFLLAAVAGLLMWGALVFVAASLASAGWLLLVVRARGDQTRTLEDYRANGTHVGR
ncbi:MAG: hypothetical protein ABW199_08130 [Caulobacterales bacterium]